jgi:hypothetical protein
MKRLLCIFIHLLFLTTFAQSQVVEAEIFFNTDPGFGKGLSLRVEPGDVVNILAELAAQNLEPGHHKAFIRVREKNTWSHNAFVGMVLVVDEKIPLLSGGDHFFNLYVPGPQVHTHPFQATGELDSEFSISTRGLQHGLNQLFFRVSDGKRHSHLVPLSFMVDQPESSFTTGEFFVTSDPGQGKATPTPMETSDILDKVLDMKPGDLNTGKNVLYFRLKNQHVWSHYATLPISVSFDPKNLPPLATFIFQISDDMERSEWIIHDLSGLGDEVDDILEISAERLPVSDHVLLLKVSDRAGRESHYTDLKFSVCEAINPIIKAEGTLLSAFADKEPDGYQWLLNGDTLAGEIKPQITITQPGEYKVIVYYDDCIDISPPYSTDDQPVTTIILSPFFSFNTLPVENFVVFSALFPFNTLEDKPEQFIVLSDLFGFDTRIRGQFVLIYSPFFFNTIRTPIVAALPLNSLTLYPNPARENVYLRSDVMVNQLHILDIGERLIRQMKVSDYEITIPVQDFETGIYFFRLETSLGWETRKMVIKK